MTDGIPDLECHGKQAKQPRQAGMNKTYLIILVLMALSGFADSLGFLYASKVWQKDTLSWVALGKSILGFGVGISLYVVSLRFMGRAGIESAEIQTAVWFAMTIIGVVLINGKFFEWPRLEQAVAALVLAGLGWLMVRTGA